MIVLKKFNTNDVLEINNSTELKKILECCNPTMLNYYKHQLEVLRVNVIVEGFGKNIRIKAKN
jgi:hypothetical protein